MRIPFTAIEISRGIRNTRNTAPVPASPVSSWLGGGFGNGGWWPLIIREPFSGAWQENRELAPDTLLAFFAVYACITLISADIGKLDIRLLERDDDVWTAVENPAYSPVLRNPNHYQNRIQFVENWIMSKLTRGNTYVLKGRDARGVVDALYVLDASNVMPLVTPRGDVYYQLSADNLNGLEDIERTVPASELIHDRMNCLFHPLVGTSPIFACALAARQGLAIQGNSANLFENGAQPGGILIAPGAISDESAERIKKRWNDNYSGVNRGKTAVMGDGMKYQQLAMTAIDSQLVEQLRMTAEVVCSVFHVPQYMIGLGTNPSYNNIEALSQMYYSQCLQSLIEAFELNLGVGLNLPREYKIGLDLDGLIRMDSQALIKTLADSVRGGLLSPNEAREKLNQPAVDGGESVYLQQQNFSLAALAARDRQSTLSPITAPVPTTTPTPDAELTPEQLTARVLARAALIKGSATP
ncbi:HK97 family phage portal protein [Paraburkholderia youngii]|uniref:phage portal protein n=1 Tax=Paraburkholderia youngii TaxID=2782701 RepID=UPI003D1B891E